jgi:hypothetical protein
MTTPKILIHAAKATYLATLYGKALDSVVGEGLLMYLHEQDIVALLRRMTGQFPHGEVIFDGYSQAMVQLVSRLAPCRVPRLS